MAEVVALVDYGAGNLHSVHNALKAAGADVTSRELAGGNHNAWDPGFGDPALPAWLFARRRR